MENLPNDQYIRRHNFDMRDRVINYPDDSDYSYDSDDSNDGGQVVEHGVFHGRWPANRFVRLSEHFRMYPNSQVHRNYRLNTNELIHRAVHRVVHFDNPIQTAEISTTRPPPPPPREMTRDELRAFLENPFDVPTPTTSDYIDERTREIYNERKALNKKKTSDALPAKVENIKLSNDAEFDRKLSALLKEDPTYTMSRPKFGFTHFEDEDLNYQDALNILERKLKALPEPAQTKSGKAKSKRDAIISDKELFMKQYVEARGNQFLINQKDVLQQMRRRRTTNFVYRA
jgi:hypothetical protein